MNTTRTHACRSAGARFAGAAAAAFVSLGLLYGVANTFHGAKAERVATAHSQRMLALESAK